MKTLEEKIAVMQAALEGAEIECRFIDDIDGWYDLFGSPGFNWVQHEYRVKEVPLIKPSINWDHVNPCFKWMATDSDGHTYLFSEIPRHDDGDTYWTLGGKPGMCVDTDGFASFTPGTRYWKDSLVERPSEE